MNDRELLEMAAKAAGIHIDKSPYNGGGIGNTGFDMAGNAVLDWHNNKKWNPLADDGDAFRLAINFGMAASFTRANDEDFVSIFDPADYQAREITMQQIGRDPYAAVRRAIVITAAEMGREIK